jgi:hypothetical protein
MASELWSLCNGFCYILGVTKENFSLARKIIITSYIIQKNQTWLPNGGPGWYIYSY